MLACHQVISNGTADGVVGFFFKEAWQLEP